MPASKPTKPVIGSLLALLALLVAGVVLINIYVQQERQRDLDSWAIRLGMIAENRVQTIETWLTAQTDALNELANNASLQLYLWNLTGREEQDPVAEPAQLSFLRNLVLASAERYGFTPGPHQPQIPANLPKRYDAGLALIDAKHRHVVSTAGMPDIGVAFEAAIRTALDKGQPTFSALVPDAYDRVLLGIAVPVPMVLGARDGQAFGGVVFAVVSAERSLFPLLKTGISGTASDESLLVMEHAGQVVYLSPTRDRSTPTRKTLPMDRSRLAAAIALRQPGSFGEYRNYQDHEVLATSRPLRSTPWVLVQEVDAQQALLESDRHRRFLVTAFSLLLFFFAAVLVAAWRHGSSVRARHDADALRRQTLALEEQTRLLHAVTDNAQAYIILMDARQQVLLANARLAALLHATPGELAGNSLTGVLGPANVQLLADGIETVQKDGTPHHCALEMTIGGEQLSLQCSLVPVERVGERRHAIMLVLQDVTELQRARQKHDELMRNLVAALMHVVDLHDPNTANHSARLVEVANAVGQALKLSAEERRTLDLAASLANLGKIFVPRELLTKTDPLTEAEQALLQHHVQFGTEMLADLDFEGPVVDTIAQRQEHLDGSGYPNRLKGDEILLTARILAVSNAFVALLSPRAYRSAISIEEALDHLLAHSADWYDRRVIAALFHVAENRKDWSEWQSGEERDGGG